MFHGVSDAGTRLLFKFRSGTHGLNCVGIGEGMAELSVFYVVMSARVFYESVMLTSIVGKTS